MACRSIQFRNDNVFIMNSSCVNSGRAALPRHFNEYFLALVVQLVVKTLNEAQYTSKIA